MKKLFFFIIAALLAISITYAQQANIYASALRVGAVTNGQVEISYFLNTDTTVLSVNFLNSNC